MTDDLSHGLRAHPTARGGEEALMSRCPSCDYPLPLDRERLGARCPRCHGPLYEGSGSARAAYAGEAACAVHVTNAASGPCQRCGNYLCEVCRCSWRGQVLCAACVDRALSSGEAAPGDARAQLRQALLGLGLGLGSWLTGGLGYLALIVAGAAQAGVSPLVALVALGFHAAATLLALFGVGQAAAAIIARGRHMILATFGLILGGLYLGLMVGIMGLSIWIA